jgi:hypothetical protein
MDKGIDTKEQQDRKGRKEECLAGRVDGWMAGS